MRLIVFAAFSAMLPFVVSLCMQRYGKCGIWTVIISPVVGLFVFTILLIVLAFLSGDM